MALQSVMAGHYGDQLRLDHAPFTPYETYTVSLSSGLTYTGTEVVLPASFSFTAQPVTLTQVAIEGETVGAPGLYTFTASYEPLTATTPITYLWDNGDNMATSVRALDVGVHTLMVTATNPAQVIVTDTHTISITEECVGVTDVDLHLVTPGTLYVGDILFFEADITPDAATKPYTYMLTFDGTPTMAMTDTVDPLVFTHTFAISGSHRVEISVWNCVSLSPAEAVTATRIVTVTVTDTCTPLTGVALGVTGTLQTNMPLTFTTDLMPDDATMPYSYTIDYDDGSPPSPTMASTDPLTLTHTYTMPGTYTVAIDVRNCDMRVSEAVTDTLQLTVEAVYTRYLPLILRER